MSRLVLHHFFAQGFLAAQGFWGAQGFCAAHGLLDAPGFWGAHGFVAAHGFAGAPGLFGAHGFAGSPKFLAMGESLPGFFGAAALVPPGFAPTAAGCAVFMNALRFASHSSMRAYRAGVSETT